MSEFFDQIAEGLPDVWFDWYGRFLPGLFGLSLYGYLLALPNVIKDNGVLGFLLAAYLIGHVLQPLSGFLTKLLESCFTNESRYKKAKQTSANPSLLNKVSKAHAEACGMLSCALALALVAFLAHDSPNLNLSYVAGAFVYFLAAFIERVNARRRKIADLPQ